MPAKFIKPCVSDIELYLMSKINDSSEAESFFDYYESNGWKVGKNPMKNWEAAVRNWIRNNKKWQSKPNNHSSNLGTIEEQAARILGKNDSDAIDADFSHVNNTQMECL